MRRKHYVLVIASLVLLIFLIGAYQENTYIRHIARQTRNILQSNNSVEEVQVKHLALVSADNAIDHKEVENLPTVFLTDPKLRPKSFNSSCANFPDIFDIKFTNNHWQTQQTSNGTFQLLNAFLDDRPLNKYNATVRILGMLDVLETKMTTFCQIWFDPKKPPTIVKVREYYHIWTKGWGGEKNGIYQPYLISCDLPSHVQHKVPISVSLVEKSCEKATNSLRIVYNKSQKKKNFVVCVKGLNFPDEDKSVRLAEWIELINLLGAEKIHFYKFSVHPNVAKLLDHYVSRGIVDVTPLTLVGYVSNVPYLQNLFLRKKTVERRLQEVIPYNDCLYRHMYEYKYLIPMDIDEVIVPAIGTWVELLDKLENSDNGKIAAYHARNVYFLDELEHKHEWFNDIPKFMHMLQHVYRFRNYTKPGYYVKCFENTTRVIATHNHFPKVCLDGQCTSKEISLTLAHLQHYRSDCVTSVKDCDNLRADSILDSRVWNFKTELVTRVVETLLDLGLLLPKTGD